MGHMWHSDELLCAYAHFVQNGPVGAQFTAAAHVPIRKSSKPVTQHHGSLLSHSNALISSQLRQSRERRETGGDAAARHMSIARRPSHIAPETNASHALRFRGIIKVLVLALSMLQNDEVNYITLHRSTKTCCLTSAR